MKDKQPSMQPCECSRCTTRWDEKQEQIRAAQREATSQSPEVLASYRDQRPLVEQGRAALEGLGQMNAAGSVVGIALEGLGAGLGQAHVATSERTFTRAEVLAVLKAVRTRWMDDGTETGGIRVRAAEQALDEALSTFERME